MSGQRIRDGLYVLVTVVIATYVDRFMLHGGWTTLTFPFVVAMWMLGPIKWVDRWVVNKWNILRGEQI